MLPQDGATATWADPKSGSRATFSLLLQRGMRPQSGGGTCAPVLLGAQQIGGDAELTKVEIGDAIPEKVCTTAAEPCRQS